MGQILVLVMLAAIKLNDEPHIAAQKIDNVWAYGLLPTKFGAAQLSISESMPELAFDICLIAAELAGEGMFQ